jgi:hypothetical protein
MTTNTGGPAFPCHPGIENPLYDGMTLRDYFAAQVAVGAMSAYWNGDRMQDPTFGDIAQQAYGIADAMLKARRA